MTRLSNKLESLIKNNRDILPVKTEEGFPETAVNPPMSIYDPPFSRYCHCHPVIATFGLTLVIVAPIFEATFPFSLDVLVSGEAVFIPVSVMLLVGALYAVGVMVLVACAVAPTLSLTV